MARAGTCQVTSNLKHNWGQQTVTEQLVTIMSSDFLFLGIDEVNLTVLLLSLIKCPGIVELHQISQVEKWQEEAEAFPHPGMEPWRSETIKTDTWNFLPPSIVMSISLLSPRDLSL